MPIVIPAIVAVAEVASAVGAAVVGTGTLAAVGSAAAVAAVNVGTLVGVVGLGMSVVGMATGNKSLAKIGGYLGMAGGVVGVAGAAAGGLGGAMQNLSQSWEDGLGKMFGSTKPVGQEELGRSIVAQANPEAGAAFKQAGQAMASQEDLGNAIVANAQMPPSSATKPTILPPELTESQKSGLITPEHVAGAERAQNIQAIANANPVSAAPPGTPSPTASLEGATEAASKTPIESGVEEPTTKFPSVGVKTGPGAGANTSILDDVSKFFGKLPDWAKAQLAITGAQGMGGALGSWFQSASAEKRLELDRQAQQWAQQYNNKNQAFQQKSQSSAPLVQFGSGTLNQGA